MVEPYEQYLKRTLSWIERASAFFSGLDERLDYLNQTMLRIESLLRGFPGAPPQITLDGRLDTIVSQLDSLVTIAQSVIPGAKVPEYSHIPIFWGKATGGTANQLVHIGMDWAPNIWAGYQLEIIEGTGAGQIRIIKSNDTNSITPASDFHTNPDSTSVYVIRTVIPYPIEKANEHNKSVTGNTNVLASDIVPSRPPSLFRILVAAGAAVFSAVITKGGVSKTMKFNSGMSLEDSCLYLFDLPVFDGDSVNFQFNSNTTLHILRVCEIFIGTQ